MALFAPELAFRAFFHYIGEVRNLDMKPLHLTLFAGTALAVALAFLGLGAFSPASAQPQKASHASGTPNNFPYEIVNGSACPRGNKTGRTRTAPGARRSRTARA
jgi:hypothetical protein